VRSFRVSTDSTPNAWAATLATLRAAGRPLLDLTSVDPGSIAGPTPLPGQASPRPLPPGGLPLAREAVSAYYADQGARVDPDDIVLTASTSEAYAHLFRLLAAPGDSFVVPRPSYPLFEPIAALESVRIEPWSLAYDGAWHLGAPPEASSGVRGVIVVQPNHPTGTWLQADELRRVEALADSAGAALVSDEVFADYAWSPPGPSSLLAGERAVPTVVLNGLSKICGLPQLKCSWIAVAGPAREKRRILEGLEWIADLFLSVNGPVQEALPDLLAGRHVFQEAVRQRIRANLGRLDRAVRATPSMSRLNADGGWVAVLRLPRVRSEERWAVDLLERGVIVHPGHFYDFEEEAHLVVSLIVEPAIFDEGLARIEAFVAEG
jgi:aspartate/methionine/tyrosine aminotransferase